MRTTWDAWLENQHRIYTELRSAAATVIQEGIRPDSSMAKRHGGPTIVLRHPTRIAQAISALSHKVGKLTGAQVYPAEYIHTSVARGGTDDRPEFGPNNPPDREILVQLTDTVQSVIERIPFLFPPCAIRYGRPLYNQEAVVLPGEPNETFLTISQILLERCADRGIYMRPPWGAHISVNRFREAIPPEKLQEFFAFMELATSPRISHPVAISVCWQASGPWVYSLGEWARFPLS